MNVIFSNPVRYCDAVSLLENGTNDFFVEVLSGGNVPNCYMFNYGKGFLSNLESVCHYIMKLAAIEFIDEKINFYVIQNNMLTRYDTRP